MEDIEKIHINEVDSTNRFMRDYTGKEGRIMTVVSAGFQTAGCGLGQNTWESERGENLLFSIMVHPKGLPAEHQFALIEAGAQAVARALQSFTDEITIKWPNDIYWRDRKIAGILSECDVSGGLIKRCIIGIGININQTKFKSDAPNPVSLCQILGKEVDAEFVYGNVLEEFRHVYLLLMSGMRDDLHRTYLDDLYRKEGVYEFEDKGGRFIASIVTVEPDGYLVLKRKDGTESKYVFKEVRYVVN